MAQQQAQSIVEQSEEELGEAHQRSEEELGEAHQENAIVTQTRGARVKNRPSWLKDFVTS